MADSISLAQAAYWPQQLLRLVLDYNLESALPTTDNVLAFIPPGGSPSWQYQIPFLPVTGSGSVEISGSDTRVPWSQMPPLGEQYTWIITLKSACGAVYAQTVLRIVAPPTLLTLVYNAVSVTAQIMPVTIGSPGFYRLAVTTSSGVLTASTQTPYETFIQLPLNEPLTGFPTFTLTTVGTEALASTSASTPMLLSAPVIQSAIYDGKRLSAKWQPVEGATEYLLRAYSTSGKPPFQVSTSATEASIPATGIDSSYLFTALAAVIPKVWASTPPLTFLLSSPQILTAAYDRAKLTAIWMPVIQATSYTMQIRSPAGPNYELQVTATDGQLSAPDLDAMQAYVFTVVAGAAGKVSSISAAMPMLLHFPVFKAGTYDGQSIVANWEAAEGATGYTIRAYSTEGDPPYQQNVPGTQGTLSAPNLTPAYSFVIFANKAGYVSAGTPAAAIMTALPQLSSALYDQLSVKAQWAPISSSLLSGYTLNVYETGGGSWAVTVGNQTTSATVALPSPLNPQGSAFVQVLAQTPRGVSAIAQRTLLIATATATSISYNGTQLQASWTAPGSGPQVTGYAIHVYSRNGRPAFNSPVLPPDSTNGTVSIPNGLDASGQYAAEIVAQAGVVSSAAAGLPVITELPVIQSARYNGSSARVEWIPVLSVDAPAFGYTLSSFSTEQGGTTNTATFPNAMVREGTVPVATPGNLNYVVQVCATAGVVKACSQPLALMQSSPQMQRVLFDGVVVSASWTAVTGASAYSLQLIQAGGVVSEITVTGTAATIAAQLTAAQGYRVTARAIAGSSTGPDSNALDVISAVPGVASVATAATSVTVVIDTSKTSGAPGVAGYQALLYQGEKAVAGPVAATSSGGVTSAQISYAVMAQYGYWVRVQAVGANPLNQAGPLSNAADVISDIPRNVLTSYDGANVTVGWEAVEKPAVTGYGVVLNTNGTPSPAIYTSATTLKVAAASGATYTVQVQAIGSAAVGQLSKAAQVVSAKPALTSASFDGQTVRAAWAIVPGANAYLVTVLSGTTPVASAVVSDTKAVVSATTGEALAVQVAALISTDGGYYQGPASTQVALILTAPAITSALSNSVSGLTTIEWSAVSGATGYSLQLFVNGSPSGDVIGTNTNQYQPSAPLTPYENLSAAVAAVRASGGVTVHGPFASAAPLVTAQPAIESVDYDGYYASAEWSAVAAATGYTISVLQSGATSAIASISVPAGSTRAALHPPISDASKTYSVVVQALGVNASGPPSAPLPLFRPGFFVSTQPASQYYPYVNPAWSLAYSSGSTLVLYLPQLAASGSLQGLPIIKGPFTLAANSDSSSSANYPYTLTIPQGSEAWTFSAAPIRTGLQTAYVDLLKEADKNGAAGFGILLLQQAISRAMPQTFQETLYYAYGLDLAAGCADLRPGLVLRVSFGDYINPGSGAPMWQSGYVGDGTGDYDIASYLGAANNSVLGFDAFIAQLVGSGAMEVNPPQTVPPGSGTPPTQSGVADAADLFFPGFRTSYLRLFFPSTLETPTGVGANYPARNFALAAAPTYTLLSSAVNYPTGSNAIAYFRGRAVAKLGMRVVINGVEQLIPVGTTVGNVLDRYGWRPPAAGVPMAGLRLERALGAAVFDPSIPYRTGQSFPVRLAWNTLPNYGPGRDSLSLPLLHGDHLTIPD